MMQGRGTEGELKESGTKASFLRFAFQTQYVSGDVGYPEGQVLPKQTAEAGDQRMERKIQW